MKQLLMILVFLTGQLCCAQIMNVSYYGIASDTMAIKSDHLIEFTTDSTATLTTQAQRPSHTKIKVNYWVANGRIFVNLATPTPTDTLTLSQSGMEQFLKTVSLRIDRNIIVDDTNRVTYIANADMSLKNVPVLFEGKIYKLNMANKLNMLQRNFGRNRKVYKKMQEKDFADRYSLTLYKGYDAYIRYGTGALPSIIEIKLK